MTTDGDDATYAEINDVSRETFKMNDNSCYSDVKSSNEKRSSLKKKNIFFVAIPVFAVVAMMVLVATCAIFAMIQVAALQQITSDNSDRLMVLRQNFSSDVQGLRQVISQLSSEMQESRADNIEELAVLKQNYLQLNLNFQQMRAALLCPHFIFSCSSLNPDCPSDYYQVRASNGSVVRVYCDMTLSCGNTTGGWMRVAELNMTDASQQCPGELVERNEAGIRQCRIGGDRCFSVHYSTPDIVYSGLCGRIAAYQVGTTNAFRHYFDTATDTINSNYVDGISLTHGNPREHICFRQRCRELQNT